MARPASAPIRAAAALACAALLWACANRGEETSGITTIGNTVAGIVVDEKGTLVANAEVRLLRDDYNPANDPSESKYASVRTDSAGRYVFREVQPGGYNLEAAREGYAAYLPGLRLTAERPDDTAPKIVLGRPGAITVVFGRVKVNPLGRFYIPGTTRNRRIDTSDLRVGSLTLPYVGAGRFLSLRYQAPMETAGVELLAPRRLDVVAGDTVTVLAETGWSLIRRINVNTTASGANVQETFAGFPVLVRLTAANFDFAKTRKDGGDIRFARPDGSRLPYELASWDPAAGTAEAWVRMDTVRGMTLAQAFYLMAGNADSAGASDPKAVFGGNGAQGTWHFDDAAMADAAAGNAAVNHGADLVDGLSGKAARFRGTAWMDIPARSFEGVVRRITITYWQKSGDTVQNQPGDVFGATDADGSVVLRMHDPFGDTTVYFQAGALDAAPLDKVEKKTDAEAENRSRWNHWALVKDADRGEMRIFLNGKLWAWASGKTASIGKVQSFALAFSGTDSYAIDEFRVHRTAKDDDWIRLAYETQKAGTTSVTVGK